MAYTPPTELLAVPPEDQPPAPPPEQQAAPAPAPEAPPPQQGGGYTPPTELLSEDAAAAVPLPEPVPGPFESAVRGAADTLGGAVAPLVAQAPQPVQNLGNMAGQVAGGLVEGATNVTSELGQGDIPGAVAAGLAVAGGPQQRVAEHVGGRVAEGKPATPTDEELAAAAPQRGILSPVLDQLDQTGIGHAIGGILTTPLPGTENLPPPPTAFGAAAAGEHPEAALTAGGLVPQFFGIDRWAEQNPDVVQQAYDQGGGQAVVDAFLDYTTGGNAAPPPQLSNPIDAATSTNPVERALQVAGAVPDFLGGWGKSGRQGTLGPFVKGMAIQAAMDPTILYPAAMGEAVNARIGRAVGGAVKRIPGVSRLGELTPEESARLTQEQTTTAFGELAQARRGQMETPLAADAGTSAAAPSPDYIPPPLTPEAQAELERMAANIPSPPTAAVPEPPFVSQYAGKPWYERPVAYTPEGEIFREDLLTPSRPRPAPSARNVPPPDPPPPINIRPRRVQIDDDLAEQVRRGEMTAQDAVNAQMQRPRATTIPPSREAIGLKGSRWVDHESRPIVENAGTPQAVIRPGARPQVEAVYRRMFDAAADEFYQPYQARFFDRDVPAADAGLLSRYRGAMTQGLFMLDDWPVERVARQLPDARGTKGFTTSRGSRYRVMPDGTTIRDRAVGGGSPGPGGIQPQSTATIYVDPALAKRIMDQLNTAPGVTHVRYEGGELIGELADGSPQFRIPAQYLDTTPSVGRSPIEIWGQGRVSVMQPGIGDLREVHFGTPITAVDDAGGAIDWSAVEHLAASGSEQTRTTARKALAGKRNYDLYVHRITTAADPDREVRNLLLTYHLDQVSGRFDAPQYANTSYWRDRARAMGDAILDAGYLPSREALDALRLMNLAEEARTAFPDIPAARLRALEGQSPIVRGRVGDELAVRTPQGQTIPIQGVADLGKVTGAAVAVDTRNLSETWDSPPAPPGTPQSILDPAPKAGTTRLYRGEAKDDIGKPPPPRPGSPEFSALDWRQQERIIKGVDDARSRWFAATPERAGWYIPEFEQHSGKLVNGRIVGAKLDRGAISYIDVPTAELEQFRVSNLAADNPARRFSIDPENEWFVPADVASARKASRDYRVLNSAADVIDQRRKELGIEAPPVKRVVNPAEEAPPTVTPEQAAPEVTPPPLPDPVVAPEEVARRQTVRAAYGGAPPELQQAVEAAVQTTEAPTTSRYGIVVSEQAARDLAKPAEGRFRFADGSEPHAGLTDEDVGIQMMLDVELWADPAALTSWGRDAEGRMSRAWQELNKRINPEGDLDPATFAGTDRAAARDELAVRLLNEAQDRARPASKTSRLGRIQTQYLSQLRQNMLFNYLNGPRYFLQNLMGNSINITARGGGARHALGYFTNVPEMVRVIRNQKSGYVTQWGARVRKMGLGDMPNVAQSSHMQYLDRLGGKTPRGLEVLSKLWTSKNFQYILNGPDQLAREHVGSGAIDRGFHALNQQLVSMTAEELRRRKIGIPDAKVRQVVRDFLDQNRTLIDPNTGRPYTTMFGRPAKFEPIWEGHEFRNYLREHLAEDMLRKPDPTALDNAVDRIFRTTQTERRAILDDASKQVDDALFSWRNTNADQLASRVFLFHYWMSRQGGLYVSEALKRPAILAAYGRMMEEMQQQAADLDQPPWMTGFFQFANSPAGFTIWHSPFDLFQSIASFADWQYGENAADAVYKDLTGLGKATNQIPYLVHPLVVLVGYELGLLGPDFQPPSVTGLETFGAKAIDLLNLANATGALPDWVNAAGVGVDANGNKVPIPHRPLQELYARVGNAISTALEPITGLTPVEVSNVISGGSQERNIASILEQNAWKAHPEWDPNNAEDQMQVYRLTNDALTDPGSDEYQAAFRQAAELPFMTDAGLPGIVQGAQRLFSPTQIYGWPEQVKLDSWTGLQPSGAAPMRTAVDATSPYGEDTFNALKYGASSTIEGRQIVEQNNEYKQLIPAPLKAAVDAKWDIYNRRLTEPVTVGGAEYTPEDLQAIYDNRKGDLWDLSNQALTDAGYTEADMDAAYQSQARYLADHPDLAQYNAYKDAINAHPGGVEGFVQETAAQNPGFAQFVRSSMMDHSTGIIDYSKAFYPDAYLASQGVRPSVYSPLVGNEPTTSPGGYPALAGVGNQPLLPKVTSTGDLTVYVDPNDAKGYADANPPVAHLPAGVPMQVIDATPRDGMVQVNIGTPQGGAPMIGYVDAALLQSNSPAPSTASAAPSAVQPSGGLAGLAGNVVGALGAAKDAIGGLFGPGTQRTASPEATAYAPGEVDPAAVTSDLTGQQVLDLAQQYVGVPYVHEFPTAETDPWTTGWDCSSFIHWLADNAGVSEVQYPNGPGYQGGGVPVGSHFQWQWAEANNLVVGSSWQDAQPGDAIYFNTDPNREWCDPANWNGCQNNLASHVGLYLGLDPATGRPRMLHAAAPEIGTTIDYLDTYPFPALGVVRWLPS